jgi:C-terminal processing protease CtpA/Prc
VKVATSHVNALGLPYLSRYVVTLDFPGKAVYLKEGQRYGEADRDDMSGIWLVDRGGRKVVVDVFPGSPAQEAGIRTGDAILGIDGHNADNMSLFELRDLLKREATSIAAVISRKGRAIELTVRLRDYSADGGR